MTYFLRGRVHDYDFLQWLVFTFAGGALCGVIVGLIVLVYMIPLTEFPETPAPNTVLTTEEQLARLSYLGNFAISLGLLFVIPVLLSLILTDNHPKRHIVPPFFIQALAYPMIGVVAVILWPIDRMVMLLLFGLSYTLILSPLQDKIVAKIVGLSGDASKMVSYSLKVNSSVDRVMEIVNDKKYRDRFRLDSSETRRIETGHWRLKSPTNAAFTIMMELKSDPSDSAKTIMNLVFYFKERYSIELTTDLQEAARMRILYLKEIFANDYMIEIEERSNIFAKSLLKDAEDDLRGISKRFESIPKAGWYQTAAFSAGMTIAMIALVSVEQYPIAAALAVPFAGYLIFDIPRKLKGGQ